MAINQIERASRAWPILISCAKNRQKITYGDLGAALGVHHRAIRYVLGVLQDFCLEERLPPITILVVNASGRPGSGFIAHDLNHFNEGLEQVFSFDWASMENPFSFSASGDSYVTLIRILSENPEQSEDVYTLVKSRGIKQILFRDALVKVYAKRCAFSGITFLEALEACHIVPWAQSLPSERLDVRNGLLLNSFHHKMFDRAYMTIRKDYRMVYFDPKGAEGTYSKLDRTLTIALHGKEMHTPHMRKHRPRHDLIDRHHEILGWEAHEVKI